MSSKKGAGALTASAVTLKLVIAAGQASASPPIGPALGQRGIKAMDFCKQFNELSSKSYQPGTPLRCRIMINQADRSFQFIIKPPLTSHLLKHAVLGSAVGTTSAQDTLLCSTGLYIAEICPQQLYEIAKIKHTDPALKTLPLHSVYKMVVASARANGFKIVRPALSP
jgi:large subunit ribosomal protein L11